MVNASITGFASRRWHISSTWARRRGFALGVDHEPDALADRDLRHVRVPERRERLLDGRALRIEDPRAGG